MSLLSSQAALATAPKENSLSRLTRISKYIKHAAMMLLAILVFGLICGTALAKDYSFKVENKTKLKIVKILVSEDKKEWGHFDIGEGIDAGVKVKLNWDKSTNNQECKQWVKAVFEGGEESNPALFDFCEDDLVVEFSAKE
jgi:hypothetical protein